MPNDPVATCEDVLGANLDETKAADDQRVGASRRRGAGLRYLSYHAR